MDIALIVQTHTLLYAEQPYDSIPNFSAADALRLTGIGRNEFIDIMNKCRSKVSIAHPLFHAYIMLSFLLARLFITHDYQVTYRLLMLVVLDLGQALFYFVKVYLMKYLLRISVHEWKMELESSSFLKPFPPPFICILHRSVL